MTGQKAIFWSCSERLLRSYSEADWIARLILTTSFAALLNFWTSLAELFAQYEASRRGFVAGVEISFCYFGPPPGFYPHFVVMVVLLIAALAAFKRVASRRFVSAVGLATALGTYICWWIDSYRIFRNFEDLQIRFLENSQLPKAAYLYGGTFLDLAVALLILTCLVIVLDRLFDGEKWSVHSSIFQSVLPNAILPCGVKDGKNYYCVGPNNEENAIRKSSSENTTDRWIAANTREGLRPLSGPRNS